MYTYMYMYMYTHHMYLYGVCTCVYPKNESHCKKLIELINYDTRNSTCTCTGFSNDLPNGLSTHVETHVFSAKLNIHA